MVSAGTHLAQENTVSVIPAIAVVMERMKVISPTMEWMGTMADLSREEDLQQRRRRKQKTPARNFKKEILMIACPGLYLPSPAAVPAPW